MVSVIFALIHDDNDAARQTYDQGNTEKVACSVNEGIRGSSSPVRAVMTLCDNGGGEEENAICPSTSRSERYLPDHHYWR